MSSIRRITQALIAGFLLVCVSVAWIIFAPVQFGGSSSYVILTGNSMEPHFHSADLVILRQAEDYQIGDIVLYYYPDLRRAVFHRIVDFKSGQYLIQGDNNAWIDDYRPARQEILGKFWMNLPGLGKGIQWAKETTHFPILAGLTGGLATAILVVQPPRKNKRSKKKPGWEWNNFMNLRSFSTLFQKKRNNIIEYPSQNPNPIKIPQIKNKLLDSILPLKYQEVRKWAGTYQIAIFLVGFLAFASVFLAYFAFTRPTTIDLPMDINYLQTGVFSYIGEGPNGISVSESAYNGAPVFPKLTCSMHLLFRYALVGNQMESITGTRQINAQILQPQIGWQQVIPLQAESSFIGNTFVTTTSANLCEMENLVQRMEEETGFHASVYQMFIAPAITVTGKIQGKIITESFNPLLGFTFDQVHFSIISDDPKIDVMKPEKTGFIASSIKEENSLSLLGLNLKVSTARVLSSAGILISIIGMLILCGFYFLVQKSGIEAMIQLKYAPILVDVDNQVATSPVKSTALKSIEDLVKLAELHGVLIQQFDDGSNHYYLAKVDETTYQFVSRVKKDNQTKAASQLSIEELREAVLRREFEVYYQTIAQSNEEKYMKAQALLRWNHPVRGPILADDFIPTAEASGIMGSIDEWMLQTVCEQLNNWQRAGKNIKLEVAFSQNWRGRETARIISQVVMNSGIDPRMLQIEFRKTYVRENI
jgi:signal peptidase I